MSDGARELGRWLHLDEDPQLTLVAGRLTVLAAVVLFGGPPDEAVEVLAKTAWGSKFASNGPPARDKFKSET
jgi:hypothetical protein